MNPNPDLKDIAKLFLKLGIIGFGGPAAHIAMMQEEVVSKRKWLTEQHFLDLIGATNLIPGPNSTEMAIHIGHEKSRLERIDCRWTLLHSACRLHHGIFCLALQRIWTIARSTTLLVRHQTCHYRHYSWSDFSIGKKITEIGGTRLDWTLGFVVFPAPLQRNLLAVWSRISRIGIGFHPK